MPLKQNPCFSSYLLGLLSVVVLSSCYHPTFRQLQCGDGQIDEGEQCDDGENNGLYNFCKLDCSGRGPSCGDGSVEETEECDDGNTINGDGCNNLCERSCGNGILELAAGEECDNGPNNADTSTCTTACLLNVCGDGYVQDEIEECDDGDLNGQNACSIHCTIASCGDGYVQNEVEECDDSNDIDGDGCETDCTRTLKTLAVGNDHSCVLFQNEKIRCWGDNTVGQLGYGNTQDIGDDEIPASQDFVPVGATVAQIIPGFYHTCALLNTGNVRCWGLDDTGQLGYGVIETIGDDETPASKGDIDVGGFILQLAAGFEHTCALLDSGNIRCWGNASSGQLGYGNEQDIGDDETPASQGFVPVGGTVVQITAGYQHTCALLDTGKVRCWGRGDLGQLGYGNTDTIGDDETPASKGDVDVGGTVVQISAGYYHTCALLDTGMVRCWGSGFSGRLGYGNTDTIGDDETPASKGDVDVGGTVVQITAGYQHTCALLDTGKVRCWGGGSYGQLGYGNTANTGDDETPASKGDVDVGGTVVQISAGYYHTCALLDTGMVRCWGYSADGQLGYGNTDTIGDNELPNSVGPVPLF